VSADASSPGLLAGWRPRRLRARQGAFWQRLLIAGGGNAAGRALGLLFSLGLAVLFAPAEYGYMRWAMSAAMLGAIPAAAGPYALACLLGMARDTPDRQRRIATVGLTAVGVAALFCGLGTAVVLHVLARPAGGVLAVLVGMTWFSGAMAVYRGAGAVWQMAALYAGGNALQLVLVLVLCGLLGITVPELALVLYGFAWLAVLVALEWRGRSALSSAPGRCERRDAVMTWQAVLGPLARLWAPLTAAHAGWTVWIWADIVLVEYFLGAAMAGYYGLARTLVTLFLLVPEAVALLLLPHVAAEGQRARGLTGRLLLLTGTVSAGLLVLIVSVAPPVLGWVAGGRYATAAVPLPGLALGMAVYAEYMVLEQHLVGLGRPGAHAIGVAVMAAGVVAGSAWTLPTLGLAGMNLVFPVAALAGLATLLALGWPALRAPLPAGERN